MNKYAQLADDSSIAKAMENLKKNGITSFVVKNGQEAKEKVLSMIPEGSEVMNMTSVTLEAIGLSQEILESGKYKAVRKTFETIEGRQKAQLGAAPEYSIGSVHALTEDGHLLIASATGSQLPAYAYGSAKVIWVVGAQKIVKDTEDGIKRIYDYVFPLENQRALKAYGAGSGVNKLLIFNKEVDDGRVTVIIVKESLGF